MSTTKLQETMNELSAVVETMTSDEIRTNPRRIVELAKVIEKGEKRMAKEHTRRLEQIKELQAELMQIAEFSDRMGYTLSKVSPDDIDPADSAPESEEENA